MISPGVLPPGDLAHNPGMCPDCELNRLPFGSQFGAQSSEPHQPGLKSMAFLYTNNELSEKETRKEISFTMVTRKIKYLGINLSKEVKDLYLENYTTLKKETEEDTNKWKHIMFMDCKN